jgi:hypothetical protein
MSDIRRSCDTLVESLQLKEGLSCQLYSCVARCEACASINDYEVNCQPQCVCRHNNSCGIEPSRRSRIATCMSTIVVHRLDSRRTVIARIEREVPSCKEM